MSFRNWCVLLAMFALGCQPKSSIEDRTLTPAKAEEQKKLVLHLHKLFTAENKRDGHFRETIPSMNGKSIEEYRAILDVADQVIHKHSEKPDVYIFWATPELGYSEVSEDQKWPGIMITTRNGKIVEVVRPPEPEY